MNNLIEFANICQKYDVNPSCFFDLINTIKKWVNCSNYYPELTKRWIGSVEQTAEQCGFKVEWENNYPILIDKEGLVVQISNGLIPNIQLNEVLQKIGLFYLNKNKFDYEAAEKEIYQLRISSVVVTDKGDVEITLSRPGLIIGRRAKNLHDLMQFISMPVKVIENDHDFYEKIIANRPMEYYEVC